MALRVVVRDYGDQAFAELSLAVQAAKAADPLALVSVVVSRGAIGLSVRRRLAASGSGVANVRPLVWNRLAADLAGERLAMSGVPVSAAAEHEAVRAQAAVATGRIAAAAREQPATVRALVRTGRELWQLAPATLDALAAQDPRTSEVVSLLRGAGQRLGRCYDAAEAVAVATERARCDPPGARRVVGDVVVYLPDGLTTIQEALVRALGAATSVHVVLGATGDEEADAPILALRDRLVGGGAGDPSPEPLASPDGPADVAAGPAPHTVIRVAPSADAEVLSALRHVMQRAAEGVALDRMAIVHPGRPPYPLLIRDSLVLAGIPFHGPGDRPLAATVPGRVLLGVLALPDHDWRRGDVAAWLSCAPLVYAAHRVPAPTWDLVSCRAGVVGGIDQWRSRLVAFAGLLRDRAGRGEAASGASTPAGLLAEVRACEQLCGFVTGLARRLSEAPSTWAGLAGWARQLQRDLLGAPAHLDAWPHEEVAAFDAVEEVLGGLDLLDTVGGPAPTLADLRAVLGAELEAPAPSTARFGQGLLVGRPGDTAGMDFEVVCVVGMVDGVFPPPVADDVLVPDAVRQRAGDQVPLRAARHAEARRGHLATVAGARERVLSYPRADQRTGRELRPARLLLDAVGRLAGVQRRLYAGDLSDMDSLVAAAPGRIDVVRSFPDAVSRGGEVVGEADWTLRSLVGWGRAHDGIGRHFLTRSDRRLAGAVAARVARRSRELTRFDGAVGPLGLDAALSGAVHSATGFEAYARCPRSFLFRSVLGVSVRERPEVVLRLGPTARGTLMHRILHRLVAEDIDVAGVDPHCGPTVERRLARLRQIADDEFAQLEGRGLAGLPALWRVDRMAMLSDLRAFVRDDARYRAATGARPVAVEQHFGFDDEGLVLDLGGDAVLRLRGSIDRIDRMPGGRLQVLDYKTGAPTRPADPADPLMGGTRLQPALYALAARERLGGTEPQHAGYWFVGRRTRPDVVAVDPEVELALGDVLRDMVVSIGEGRFPGHPGDPGDPVSHAAGHGSRAERHCATCPFDQLCPPDRSAQWRRKRGAPGASRGPERLARPGGLRAG